MLFKIVKYLKKWIVQPANWYWQGLNQQDKLQDGLAKQITRQQLCEQLKSQSITVLTLKRRRAGSRQKKITPADLTNFFQQLAHTLQAGLSLQKALLLLSEHQSISMQALLAGINDKITQGSSFHQSLSHFPRYFSSLHCALIQTGEESGRLVEVLQYLSHFMRQQQQLYQQIRKASFYPLMILGIAIVITTGLLLFMVPRFEAIYQNMGAKLPWITTVLIQLTHWLKNDLLYTLLLVLVLLSAWCYGVRHIKKPIVAWQNLILIIPPIRAWLVLKAINYWLNTLTINRQAGLPLVPAITLANKVIYNSPFQSIFQEISHGIQQGKSLAIVLEKSELFPSTMIQMIAVSEQSGQLTEILKKITEDSQRILQEKITRLCQLLEPCLMLLISLIIGIVIISMYLPIFQLGTALQ